MNRIATIVKGYPRLSETFIAQEILGLEKRGLSQLIVSLRHPTECARHAAARATEIHNAIEAKAAESWESKGNLPVYVADRITALVAIHGGVGQFADAGAVHDDQDDSIWRRDGQGTEPASSERSAGQPASP